MIKQSWVSVKSVSSCSISTKDRELPMTNEIVDKIKKVIYGTLNIDEIETTDIEKMNSISRERLGRLVRETKCFSKKKPRLINAFESFHFYWNFMDKLTKSETPAMLEGLADHQWNWEQFFN